MARKIKVIKGSYRKIKLSDTVFTLLKPLMSISGRDYANVDASSVLGDEHSNIMITLEDYKMLD